jgi:signal recognition particle subunit SRP19
MKRPGQIVVWPSQLDSTLTRSQGRTLPVARAVRQPTLREISQAATMLGYSPQINEKAGLPKASWHKTGYVILKKTGRRQSVLKNLAGEIVKNRQKEVQAVDQKKK